MHLPVPDGQMFLDFSDQAHGGVRARVHGGQDRDDNKQPRGRTSRIHAGDHVVLYERENLQTHKKQNPHKLISGVCGGLYLQPNNTFLPRAKT